MGIDPNFKSNPAAASQFGRLLSVKWSWNRKFLFFNGLQVKLFYFSIINLGNWGMGGTELLVCIPWSVNILMLSAVRYFHITAQHQN